MFILGTCLGVLHPILPHMLAVLQDWSLSADRILLEGLPQALAFPVAWALVYLISHHLPVNPHAV